MESFKRYAYALLQKTVNVNGLFVLVFLAAWFANGANGTTFDMGALATAYACISGVGVTRYGINSVLNSPRGQAPQENKREGR